MQTFSRRQALGSISAAAAAIAAAAPMFAANAAEESHPAPSEVGFTDGKFVLPPLPYDYNALEPAIDETTMHLHHDIHHAAYVKGANAALEALNAIASGAGDAKFIAHWNGELAFHASGHALHTLFWNNMKPKGSAPGGDLLAALNAGFGSKEGFEKLFAATAASVQGSGWAILGYDCVSKRLLVLSAEKHQNLTIQSITPIMAIDVWEHAYYLKYQNKRVDYIKAFMGVVNYDFVAARLAKAVAAA